MAEDINYIAKDEMFKTAIVSDSNEEYGSYLVSNYGRIYSLVSKKFLKGFKDYKGYIQYYLYKNGKRKHISEHRLVGFAYVKNDDPEGKKIINHKDQTTDFNYHKNLEWCNHSYNLTYGNAQAKRIAKISKPVLQMDNEHNPIATYPSLTEASRSVKSSISTIFVACNSGLKRKGYYWAYDNGGA